MCEKKYSAAYLLEDRRENGKGLPSLQKRERQRSPFATVYEWHGVSPADDLGIAEGHPSHTVWSFCAGSPFLLLPLVVMLPGRRVGLP